MKHNRFVTLLLAFALALVLLDVPAHAAESITVELTGGAASGMLVDLKGLPGDCRGIQATLTLDRQAAAQFTFDSGLSGSGMHCAYTQTGGSVTLYAVSKQPLGVNGTLRLGILSGPFGVTSVSGVKLLDGSLRESLWDGKLNVVPSINNPGGSTSPNGNPGTGDPFTYRVNVPAGLKNGTVEVSAARAEAGATVTVYATPKEGYVLESISAVTAAGAAVDLTEVGQGRYSFVMPAAAVTIEASFVQAADDEPQKPQEPESLPFVDVPANMWYYGAVSYAYSRGLMNGVSANGFDPDGVTTRGQIVTILHRLEGEPAAASAGRFTDVAAGQWYTQAVNWAAEYGIVDGFGDGTFCPEDVITREQLAAILYRYTRFKGVSTSASGSLAAFADAGSVSPWAVEALTWANGAGLINGKNGNLLDPTGSATRAEVATILMRIGAGN